MTKLIGAWLLIFLAGGTGLYLAIETGSILPLGTVMLMALATYTLGDYYGKDAGRREGFKFGHWRGWNDRDEQLKDDQKNEYRESQRERIRRR